MIKNYFRLVNFKVSLILASPPPPPKKKKGRKKIFKKKICLINTIFTFISSQGRGKTTLLATLQGKKPPPNISTVGITVEQWSLSPPSKSTAFNLFKVSCYYLLFFFLDLKGFSFFF